MDYLNLEGEGGVFRVVPGVVRDGDEAVARSK